MGLKGITQENFNLEVRDSKIPVLLDFWAPWCGPCKMMGPVFEDLSHEYEGRLKFAKVNTDEQQELSAMFGISGIPCLLMIEDGKEKDRIVGFAPKDALKQKIDALLT